MIYLFVRDTHFYPIEIPPGHDTPEKLAEHARLNPGTRQIQDASGKIVWQETRQ